MLESYLSISKVARPLFSPSLHDTPQASDLTIMIPTLILLLTLVDDADVDAVQYGRLVGENLTALVCSETDDCLT